MAAPMITSYAARNAMLRSSSYGCEEEECDDDDDDNYGE